MILIRELSIDLRADLARLAENLLSSSYLGYRLILNLPTKNALTVANRPTCLRFSRSARAVT